jgi:hypothetical protein
MLEFKMNERIKELAEQANAHETGHAYYRGEKKPENAVTLHSVDLELFAELIVRECAKIADSADESACEWIGGNILTHFGVGDAPVNDVDRILRTVRTRG